MINLTHLKEYLPRELLIFSENGFESQHGGEVMKMLPADEYYFPFPLNDYDIDTILSDLTGKPKLERVDKETIEITLELLRQDIEFLQDKRIAKAVASSSLCFAIDFQVGLMGDYPSPSHITNKKTGRTSISYPAGCEYFSERDRELGYSLYAHEAAHNLDDDKYHSTTKLFQSCFDHDLATYPEGLAARTKELVCEYSSYEPDNERIYGEFFASFTALMCTHVDEYRSKYPKSALVKYFELVERQMDNFINIPGDVAHKAESQRIHDRISSQNRRAKQAHNADCSDEQKHELLSRIVDEVKVPAKGCLPLAGLFCRS